MFIPVAGITRKERKRIENQTIEEIASIRTYRDNACWVHKFYAQVGIVSSCMFSILLYADFALFSLPFLSVAAFSAYMIVKTMNVVIEMNAMEIKKLEDYRHDLVMLKELTFDDETSAVIESNKGETNDNS